MTEFAGIPRGTLADRVYIEMRAAILSGAITDGTELNQVGLARQFEVSRVPVREALRRLQAEQLVTVTPYQQYVVTPVNRKTLVELIDIRAELEVFAVRRRMRNMTSEIEMQLRDFNAGLRAQSDTQLWFEADIEFHDLINGVGTEAARMVRNIRERVHRYLHTVASTQNRQQQACAEHERIIDAMVAGDETAMERAIREHIIHTRDVITEHLRQSNADAAAARLAQE
jgi:DNA-binding GntR family transcriptional regulator